MERSDEILAALVIKYLAVAHEDHRAVDDDAGDGEYLVSTALLSAWTSFTIHTTVSEGREIVVEDAIVRVRAAFARQLTVENIAKSIETDDLPR
jgi:hypothetical protein